MTLPHQENKTILVVSIALLALGVSVHLRAQSTALGTVAGNESASVNASDVGEEVRTAANVTADQFYGANSTLSSIRAPQAEPFFLRRIKMGDLVFDPDSPHEAAGCGGRLCNPIYPCCAGYQCVIICGSTCMHFGRCE